MLCLASRRGISCALQLGPTQPVFFYLCLPEKLESVLEQLSTVSRFHFVGRARTCYTDLVFNKYYHFSHFNHLTLLVRTYSDKVITLANSSYKKNLFMHILWKAPMTFLLHVLPTKWCTDLLCIPTHCCTPASFPTDVKNLSMLIIQ